MSAPFVGLAQLVHPGHRFALGAWIDGAGGGGYAIWSAAGGAPLATFPVGNPADPAETASAWDAASRTWAAWEQPAATWASPPRGVIGGSTAAVVIVLAVVYFLAHNYVYRNCLSAPDLFSWPHQCL